MIRGGDFYAVWDDEAKMWSTNEYDVSRMIDEKLESYFEEVKEHKNDDSASYSLAKMSDYSSKSWRDWRGYIQSLPDSYHQLDDVLTFANSKTKKTDYASKRLSYSLEDGDYSAWDELVGVLYSEEERAKIEWTIGAIISGDSKSIQKFVVFYGAAGAGKSTILNIVQKLFDGYYTTFEAKALGSNGNAFSTEAFKYNPLVAIQHDGDLSHIEDNSKLNSIVSHEEMVLNEKYKSSYSSKINAFLLMATNRPVKITDAKSGIIRRLIVVSPSGNKIAAGHYQQLMSKINFQLGAIAKHCLDVYIQMGKHYYDDYRPTEMMLSTDVFYNFVKDMAYIFEEEDKITLTKAYDMYKSYCDETLIQFKMPRYKFRDELMNYFDKFEPIGYIGDKHCRSIYSGFNLSREKGVVVDSGGDADWLVLKQQKSILDDILADCPAQYASANDIPTKKWSDVTTKLCDIDTSRIHYVKVPDNHIVIDFDLKDPNGEKSSKLNLDAASKWPKTYSEFSKSGQGVHLHYIYDGDASKLSRVYSDGIEIKVFSGNSSLRRKLSLCNDMPVAHISTGLPLREWKVINFDAVKSEKGLRSIISRNLAKEIHPGTKPSIDFIFKILEDAYSSDLHYDVTDMRPKVLAFAANSTHQSKYCVDLVAKMHFASKDISANTDAEDTRLVFFDVEVFPNLFLVNWKYQGTDTCVRMVNPTSKDIESLLTMRLVGFNCRRYDNHILYARYLGYSNEDLYNLSQKIISGNKNAFFGEAYNISYTDVYDFSSKKQSLKKFEIELGIHHQELGLPWDQPVPEDKWNLVAEYCDNDVFATEAVFNARHSDFVAREILADLSGLTVNDTTNSHSARIIFGKDRHPQDKFVYTDLSEMFPGYVFENGKSTYMGIEVGEGGRVYSQPGMYWNVALLDVASMHPTSIEQLNLFGPYTKVFSELKQARIYIKHGDFENASKMFGGKLSKYLDDKDAAKSLAYALKIVINSIYGLTSAGFANPFRDPRNKDNIVAKRGALFMVNLQRECEYRGWTVVHIKTDSIKLANATQEMIDFVMDYGKKYGYIFEHESTYDRMCIVNDAVYIAHSCYGEHNGEWTATGAQFQQPYIFKKLFSKEPIIFDDMCEPKSCTTAMYLDMNENLSEDEHNYIFVGKTGLFCPIKEGHGGGLLYREKDGKYYSVSGTKGYRWLESETVRSLHLEDSIDEGYYRKLVDDAVNDISKYGDFEFFANGLDNVELPWCEETCDCEKCSKSLDCPIYLNEKE